MPNLNIPKRIKLPKTFIKIWICSSLAKTKELFNHFRVIINRNLYKAILSYFIP